MQFQRLWEECKNIFFKSTAVEKSVEIEIDVSHEDTSLRIIEIGAQMLKPSFKAR